MGYWSNGTECERWEARYCDRCVHNREDEFCPVMELHERWMRESVAAANDRYHQRPVSDPVSETKLIALEALVPQTQGGLDNHCRMFHAREAA